MPLRLDRRNPIQGGQMAYASMRDGAELMDFVRFPSVSAQPNHAGDVRRCAEWLAGRLHGVGLEHVAVMPTGRHPIVYADWLHAPGKPVLLVYGHYDVQPADPLAE